MKFLAYIRRFRRAFSALLVLALLVSTLQAVWHQPMSFALASDPVLARVVCGGPLSSADVAKLVEIGILPAGSADAGSALCELLTAPATVAITLVLDVPGAVPAGIAVLAPAAMLPVAPRFLPPQRGPPAHA